MRRVSASAITMLSVVALTGCDGRLFAPDDTIVCTAEFVYGLRVQVRDAATGAPAGSGATVRASAGGFSETLQPVPAQEGQPLDFYGVGERPGVYTVSVVRSGYAPWSLGDVTIGSDECHVVPVKLAVDLTPLD